METQYRVAVAYQNAAWDKGSFMLDDIFRKVKQDEIVRRMNLREFLVAFVQRQQRLFLSLQGVNNKVLEGLVSKELNQVDIEREIQSTITNRTKAGALLSEMLENENPNLDSPLNSDLLSKAKVVQRRGLAGGVATIGSNFEWKISLAIVTADCYLHFFDIEDPRVDATSPPDVAFQALMPTVIAPTSDNLALGKSNFSKGWSDPLAPTDSMILAKCVLQGIDETSFTLIEKGGGATTASKMFGKLVDKKVQIRSQGKGEKDDFIAILTTQY